MVKETTIISVTASSGEPSPIQRDARANEPVASVAISSNSRTMMPPMKMYTRSNCDPAAIAQSSVLRYGEHATTATRKVIDRTSAAMIRRNR
eukprot:4951836-Prymnesium_polylepis.2